MFTEERARWIYQHYRWLEAHLPKRTGGRAPVLVVPTPDFYPHANTHDHAFAVAMFETTQELMELQNWKCRLSGSNQDLLQPVDMRKSFNRLWAAVWEQLQEDPKSDPVRIVPARHDLVRIVPERVSAR